MTWQINLCWKAQERLAENYTVFLHLVDSTGDLLAQTDAPPQQGQYPTHLWEQGDIVRDLHNLRLPSDLAPGRYSLNVGLYVPRMASACPFWT